MSFVAVVAGSADEFVEGRRGREGARQASPPPSTSTPAPTGTKADSPAGIVAGSQSNALVEFVAVVAGE